MTAEDAEGLGYPADLPVVAHRAEILAALNRARVVIVSGDTGSGKTTQLPKMALEAGCGVRGLIACTQPRRLATVTMAERVASELKTPLGGLVGYHHRFGRRLSDDTRVLFMTDGVLLAEIRTDPLFRRYDCIIVDEAHERSLNIDFLLGILKRILARRRDLKVIISSATLDVARFSAFFDHAPVVSVPGRLYPVETRYRPVPDGLERDLPRDVSAALATLPRTADTLVFLPGERDIRECADALAETGDDVIPLLASLPADEQKRAFRLSARRRIVLATNVAETSVTIPGIRAVIDSGLVRLSRYLPRTHVQRLQIESVSQASACQRQGRCGRVGPGICIRLYSEEDYQAREPYTTPEIQRASLAGVILTMLDLGLGDIAAFPFLEAPRPTAIAEGLRELIELNAVARDAEGRACLSPIGRKLARIPVEPRLARILLAASEWATLPSVLPVVAAMSCDDPRRRPAEEREKAAQAHAPFRVEGSDFLGTHKLWTWYAEQSAALSQTKLRKLCKTTYLSYPKMREWVDLVHQLERLCRQLKLDMRQGDGGADAFHRALLSGLLSRIGHYNAEARLYRGARGLQFALHPSSVLAKRPKKRDRLPVLPEWIVANELVDTERLQAREAAVIDVRWIEPAAGALAKRHCHSPYWDRLTGYVRATEQVTLYGLVIVPARRCDFSRYDPALARELFIRHGLVGAAFPNPPPAVRENNALLLALRRQAEKYRRANVFDEDALVRHFDAVLPPDICSAPQLVRWLRHATEAVRARFRLKKEDWWPAESDARRDFPDTLRIGHATLHFSYRNAPDDPAHDGITCTVRKSDAGALALWRSEWLVPGALPEKLFWMLSVLPTAERRVLAPLDDTLAGLRAKLAFGAEPLEEAVVRIIRTEWGFRISPEAWRRARLPDHLRMRFVVRDDETGRVLVDSRDRADVVAAVGLDAADASASCTVDARGRQTAWTFGDIPETMRDARAPWQVAHYPALHDEGDGVSLRLHAEPEEARLAHEAGVARLYALRCARSDHPALRARDFSLAALLFLKEIGYETARMERDILAGAVRAAYVEGLPAVRTQAAFEARYSERRSAFIAARAEIARLAQAAVNRAADLINRLDNDARLDPQTAESVQTQLIWLVARGFPATTPLARLRRYEKYFRAIDVRLERAHVSRSSDLSKEARFAPHWQRYRASCAQATASCVAQAQRQRFRWLLEELRISLFAQELKTDEPISEKHLSEFELP